MDLNVIINNALTELKEEGLVEKIVKQQLEKTLSEIVSDSLRSYGDFGKKVKEQVNEQLQINLDKLDIPSYNQVILNAIEGELERSVHDIGVLKMQENLRELLGTGEETYKLSALVKTMVDEDCELNELDYEERKEITVIEEDFYGITYIYMDTEEDQRKYDCKYRIGLDKKTGKVETVNIGNKEFKNSVIMGGLYGLDKTLFKIWTQGSKLEIDNYETVFSNPEY